MFFSKNQVKNSTFAAGRAWSYQWYHYDALSMVHLMLQNGEVIRPPKLTGTF